MDVLTDWVRLTGTSGMLLARSRVQPPWGIALPRSEDARFHIVREGECWLRIAGQPPSRLGTGDVALLSSGLAHELVHAPDGEAEPLAQWLDRAPPPLGPGSVTTVLCGVYRFDVSLARPLLRGLPSVLHLDAEAVRRAPRLEQVLELIAGELEQPAAGSPCLLPHLFNAALIYLVRAWLAEADTSGGWLSALRDSSLALALSRMHAQPANAWTVEALAREGNLSRAAFARRFTEKLGEAPLAYLTRWRMGLAARMLRSSDASLAEIASRVGYDSEFSFSRAFKRIHGQPPSAYRRSATAPALEARTAGEAG